LVAVISDEVVGFVVSFRDAFGSNYVARKRIGEIQVVHTKRACAYFNVFHGVYACVFAIYHTRFYASTLNFHPISPQELTRLTQQIFQ